MKRLFCFLVAALLGGCVATPYLTAVGNRNPAGSPVGEYKIVAKPDRTIAQGSFRDGLMDGPWSFYDSHVKVADVSYQHGVAAGPFRTYFGSVAFPSSAGRLQSEGQLRNGRVFGRYLSYDRTGVQVDCEANFDASGVVHAKVGPEASAVRLARNDVLFIRSLDGPVHAALR